MTIKGIDVSSWNGWPFNAITEKGYAESKFIIAKATQGIDYVNPYCDLAIQRAIEDGKLFGFYHYAEGKDAKAEANYFYSNCKGYIGKGIPALDWESEQNPAFGNSHWCLEFCTEFHRLSGVWPIIYVQRSAVHQIANCATYCGLWVAEWETSQPGNIEPWSTYTIWQYTSTQGTLDKNIAQLDNESWMKIARGDKTEPSPKPDTSELDKAIDIFAREVLAGRFGNGDARKEAIYKAVQDRVNEMLGD